MKRLHLLLVAFVPLIASSALAQSSGGTPPSSATPGSATPGAGPQQDRDRLCDGKPCEDADRERDMQKLHAQDMEWLDNYGPAAGGSPGTAQRHGPHGPDRDKGGPPGGQQGPQQQGAGAGPGPH